VLITEEALANCVVTGDENRRLSRRKSRKKKRTQSQLDMAAMKKFRKEEDNRLDLKCTLTACKCGFKCDEVRSTWSSVVGPMRARLRARCDADRRHLLSTMISCEEPTPGPGRKRTSKKCGTCVDGCVGHVKLERPYCKYHLGTKRVCKSMFVNAVRGLITKNAVETIAKGVRTGTPIMQKKRGGARRFANPTFLALLFEFVNDNVPRELRHYSLTQAVDYEQVVLNREWLPSKIYREFIKLYDPMYYWYRKRLRRQLPSETIPVVRPRLSEAKARKELRTLNTKLGQDSKDKCPVCYSHAMHIRLGADTNASAKTKTKAENHRILLAEHRSITNRAILQQDAERKVCLEWNDVIADPTQTVKYSGCNCHELEGWGPTSTCACKWKELPGFTLFQLDKGSKLPLPMSGITPLWYKSTSNMYVEHITDWSLPPRHRRSAYFWEESVAAAGKVNMISVLDHYVHHHPSGRKGLILWMDNCFHEFKNWTFCFYLAHLVQVEGMFDWIEVKYYETGHSYMGGYGPDSTHGHIRNAGRDNTETLIPKDWMDAAGRACGGDIHVEDFSGELQHRNWHNYLAQFWKVDTGVGRSGRKVDTSGNPVDLRKFRALLVCAEEPGMLTAYTTIDGATVPVKICMVKKVMPSKVLSDVTHPSFNLRANPLSYNQVKGIMASWTYMPLAKAGKKAVARAYWELRLKDQECIVADEAGRARANTTFAALLTAVRENLTDVDTCSDQGDSSDDAAAVGPGEAARRAKEVKNNRKGRRLTYKKARKAVIERNAKADRAEVAVALAAL
jgi:hypothetical protein